MRVFVNKLGNMKGYGVALAVPMLLVALLIAAAVTANPTQAQDPGEGPGLGPILVDPNKINYKTPYPCNGDEAVPDSASATIDTEHYAVFDAFWDYNNNRLSMNFCPPGAEHTTTVNPVTRKKTTRTTRSTSTIDIRKTVLSITDVNTAGVVDTVTTSTSTRQISRAIYRFLPASPTQVWWLEEDDDTTLAMGFSTGLLKKEHWENPVSGEKPVQFEFEAIERPGAHGSEEAHFYVFETSDTPVEGALWDSSKTDTRQMDMDAEQYRHFNWVFTHPGTYRIQVQAKAHVKRPSLLGIPRGEETLTSVAQLYTFHVGPEDDLSVGVAPAEQTLAANATSTSFTVTANNNGPNTSTDTMVQVYLPEGLEANTSTLPSSATYEGGVIAWKLGRLPRTLSSTTPTLTFSANVGSGASGRLTVTAEIRNLNSDELDSNSDNNIASAVVQLASGSKVRPPFFAGVTRSIVEHAVPNAHAGDPVAVRNPDGRPLTFKLAGRGSDKFAIQDNVQIVLAANATLDYEKQWEYRLILHVSDGVDSMGNPDTSTDDSIPVFIEVIDTPEGSVHPTVTFSISNPDPNSCYQRNLDLDYPVVFYAVSIDPVVNNLPSGVTPTYTWEDDSGDTEQQQGGSAPSYEVTEGFPGTHTYTLHIKWNGGGITAKYNLRWYEANPPDYPAPPTPDDPPC